MSATTTRETEGFVAETLRRPIQDAVREGVREALQEQRVTTRTQEQDRPEQEEGSGSNWGRYVLLALVGLGVAAFVMRRRSGGSGGGIGQRTSEIRERGKTAEEPTGSDVATKGGIEATEESVEEEDAAESATPGTRGEDD